MERTLNLNVNSDKVRNGLNDVDSRLKKTQRVGMTAAQMIGGAFKKLAGGIFSVKGAIVGLAGGLGIGALVDASLKAIDTIGKMSSLYRISTQDVGALSLASSIGGSNIDVMTKALKVMSGAMDDFRRGTGAAKIGLDSIGVTMNQVKSFGNDQIGVMAFLADKLNEVEDSTKRLAIANDIFGGKGLDVLNVMKGGTKAMEEFRKENEALGGALSGQTVAGVESTNDSITRLSTLFSNLRNQIVGALAPAIQLGVDTFKNWILEVSASQGGIEQFARNAAAAILGGAIKMVEGLQGVIGWLEKLKTKLEEYGIIEKKIKEDSIAGQNQLIRSIDDSLRLASRGHMLESDRLMLVNARAAAVSRLAELQVQENNTELTGLELLKEKLRVMQQTVQQAQSGVTGAGTTAPTLGGGIAPTDTSVMGTEGFQARAEADLSSFMTEEQRLQESYTRRGVIVSNAFAQGLIEQEQRDSLMLGLREQHEADKTRITEEGEAQRRAVMSAGLGAAASIFGSLATLMKREGKKQSAIQKVLAKAAIITSTAQAVMNALAVPPYPLGVSLAAAAALQGAIQLKNIGAGGGGGSGFSPVSSSPALAGTAISTPSVAGGRGETVVQLHGNFYGWNGQVIDELTAGIVDAIDNRDVRLISPNSRNGQELAGAA